MLDRENPNNVFNQAAQRGSGYIGNVTIAAHADPGNTGIVTTDRKSLVKANTGDNVMYLGPNTGTGANVWRAGYMYQWDGRYNRWNELIRNDNWEKYVVGAANLPDGFPEAMFSVGFIKTLFAQTVNADLVRARMRLQVGNDANYIEINGNALDAYIKSSNYSAANKTGFLLDYLGNVYLNKGTFREGIFEDIVGTNLSIQGGTVNIGPLFVSDDKTASSATKTYPASTTLTTFFNEYLPGNPDPTAQNTISRSVPIYYGGTLGSWSLYSIVFYKGYRLYGSGEQSYYGLYYRVEFNTSGGMVAVDNSNPATQLGYQVVINGGGSGSTFKLTGLPTVAPVGSDASGKLWRDPGTNYLKIVP